MRPVEEVRESVNGCSRTADASGNYVALSSLFFIIAYGDRVTVYVTEKCCHTNRYDENITRTGVRLGVLIA